MIHNGWHALKQKRTKLVSSDHIPKSLNKQLIFLLIIHTAKIKHSDQQDNTNLKKNVQRLAT